MNAIRIGATQEPSLVQIVVHVVTKDGQYLDKSQAQFLIGRGDVIVNGLKIRDIGMILEPGHYTFKIRDRGYNVEVVEIEKE